MDKGKLAEANSSLDQKSSSNKKWMLWLIIGIVVGVVAVILIIIFFATRSNSNGSSSSYPYILSPQNTIQSTSLRDVLTNLVMDINNTAIDYSVIARLDIK